MAKKVTKTQKTNGKDLSPCIMVEKVWSKKNGTHIGACLSLYAKWVDDIYSMASELTIMDQLVNGCVFLTLKENVVFTSVISPQVPIS